MLRGSVGLLLTALIGSGCMGSVEQDSGQVSASTAVHIQSASKVLSDACATDSYACGPLSREMRERADAADGGFVSGSFSFAKPVPATRPSVPDLPVASFAGMHDDDPSAEGYAFLLCGYLFIEEPYVHVLATESEYRTLPDEMHQELPRRGDGDLLYFMLMLPRAQTRYDSHTRSLWVNDDGPFTDGNHVAAVGVRGDPLDLAADSVHERLPWRTVGMLRAEDEYGCHDSPRTRADRAAGTVPSLTEVPPAAFEGMWDHDPADSGDMAELCGYLIIEEPYVHVLETERDWRQDTGPGLARSDSGNLLYSMLMLPRPGTRYDPATRSLWVYREGPMTDGDHVTVGGGVGRRQPDWPGPNVHQRQLWQANSMGPADYPC